MIEAFLLADETSVLKPAHGTPGKWRAFLDTVLSWGPGGLFVLAVLDSAGLPVIGGVDLLLVNIAAARPQDAYWAAICAIAGSLTGSAILFGIARKGGELMLARHTASGRGARLHRWFERYGLITVFIPALSPLPLPMKVPVFCAGALEVQPLRFYVVLLTARTLRYVGLAFFGARYGVQTLLYLRGHVVGVSLIAIGLAAAGVIALQIRGRRGRGRAQVPSLSQ